LRGNTWDTRLFKIAATGRLRAVLLSIVMLGATGIALAAYATDVLKALEGTTVDTRFSIRGKEKPPKNLVIVAVDDKSLQDINQQWAWPRAIQAQAISRIAAQHPAAIAYDIELADKSSHGKTCKVSGLTLMCDDLNLLNTLGNIPPVTLFSTTAPSTDGKGNVRFLGVDDGTKLLHELGSRPAETQFPFQSGGTVRQMKYSIQGIQTMAVVAYDTAMHKHLAPAQFGTGAQWIDYQGPSGTIPSVPFSSVYDQRKFGALPPNLFRGKIVVVGAIASSLQDFHPASTDQQMPGPELQANTIATILKGFPLKSAPGWINVVLIVLFAIVVPLASLRLNTFATLGLTLGLAALFAIGTQLAFDAGRVNSFVYPLVALILSGAGALAVKLVTEAFERIRAVDLFSRFVPENVVDEVLASADGLRLGGVQREGTVMFSDLRGFTSLAETMEPARVIETLNRYLSEMSDAILDHGGTLVAYMGDGIMAVFGAPLPQPDHADRALAAAREMLEVRLPRFNEWLRSENLSQGFRMGIGLNSGQVMSGHVGSERRVEYTAVGDTTNTSSRIEALTKGTPYQLYLSGATKEALLSPPDDLVHVGATEIRGRQAKLELWTVAAEAPEPDDLQESEIAKEPEPLQASGPAGIGSPRHRN
jgi:adenylate cyclase